MKLIEPHAFSLMHLCSDRDSESDSHDMLSFSSYAFFFFFSHGEDNATVNQISSRWPGKCDSERNGRKWAPGLARDNDSEPEQSS